MRPADSTGIHFSAGEPPQACNSTAFGNSWKVELCPLIDNGTTNEGNTECTFHCENPEPIFVTFLETRSIVSVCDVSYEKLSEKV